MPTIIPTHRPWTQRLADWLADIRARRRASMALRELDRRTLSDIGVDASELSSIQAESQARARLTRLRIVAANTQA